MDIENKQEKQIVFIAEIGSNYNDDLELAKRCIRASSDVGASAVKFQTLRKVKLVAPQIWSSGSSKDNPVYNNFSNLELPDDWHYIFKNEADKHGIEFFSTPFYLEAVELLEAVGVATYKIASGDITFIPLLEAVGRTGKRVLLSTGASPLADVEKALNLLVQSGAGPVTILHCVSNYPPKWNEMNLRAIVQLKQEFGLPVGISDHSPGSLVPIAAVALGATVIEKHVTFSREPAGPDHGFAMTFEEFGSMVKEIRHLEQALGTGEKVPTESELAKQHRMRRGIYDPTTFEPTGELNGIWLRPKYE